MPKLLQNNIINFFNRTPINKVCFLCSSSQSILVSRLGSYSLIKCSKCGLQFLDPIPDKTALENIYSDYYRAWDIKQSEYEVSVMKMKSFQMYLAKISNFVSSGTLLDVGCATGELMKVAQGMGFDVYGVEISPEGIRRCKEKFGENKVKGSYLESGDFPSNFFDVVTLSDVLEHVPDPIIFLENIYNILKPNGVLMIVTPDTSSWTRKIMGMHWLHYKQEHIYYYSSYNICKLLSSNFDILIFSPAYKILTFHYCASIIAAYSNTRALKKIACLLKYLLSWTKSYSFLINIGEIFVLCRKKS